MRLNDGFTLVEMMAVVAILSVVSLMILPIAQITTQREKERELRRALWTIRDAIDAYKRDVDQGLAASATPSGYPPSLTILVAGVPDARAVGSIRRYLRQLPRDPFAPPEIAAESSWGIRSYASPVDEPRQIDDVYDVHSTATRLGTNGIPLRSW